MYVASNNEYLVMSTNENNVKFAKFWFRIKGKIKEVEELYIYDVLNKFKKLRKFEEMPYTYSGGYGCYGGYSNHRSFGDSRCAGYDDDYHYTGRHVSDSMGNDGDWVKDDRLTIDDKIPEKSDEEKAEATAIAIVKKEMDGD